MHARLLPSVLLLALLAPLARAQDVKIVHDPALAGGEILVQGLLHVRFVGDWREAPAPEVLTTAWTTYAPTGKPRRVLVLEERAPGQGEASWRAEHRLLVSKVAATYPPASSQTLSPRSGRRPSPRGR